MNNPAVSNPGENNNLARNSQVERYVRYVPYELTPAFHRNSKMGHQWKLRHTSTEKYSHRPSVENYGWAIHRNSDNAYKFAAPPLLTSRMLQDVKDVQCQLLKILLYSFSGRCAGPCIWHKYKTQEKRYTAQNPIQSTEIIWESPGIPSQSHKIPGNPKEFSESNLCMKERQVHCGTLLKELA